MKNFYKKPSEFTTLPNAFAQNSRLSIEARGLGLHIFSLPEDWVFRQTYFYDKCGGTGANRRKTVVKALNELIKYGYLARSQARNAGRFEEAIWMFDPEGGAREALEAVLLSTESTESADGSISTVGTQSASPESAGPARATKKEIEKKEKRKKEENTPHNPPKGSGGELRDYSGMDAIAALHGVTSETLEEYVLFRKNSGGIEFPSAFDRALIKNLSDLQSLESQTLEKWLHSLGYEGQIIDYLTKEFLSSSTVYFSRKYCRDRAIEDFVLKMNNIQPSDVAIEIAFQKAQEIRDQKAAS